MMLVGRRRWVTPIMSALVIIQMVMIFLLWSAFPQVFDHVQKADGHAHTHVFAGLEMNLVAFAKVDAALENDLRQLRVAGGQLEGGGKHNDDYVVEKAAQAFTSKQPGARTIHTTTELPRVTERPTYDAPANEPIIPPIPGCNKTYGVVVLHWDPHWTAHMIPHGLRELEVCVPMCIRLMHTSDRRFQRRADIIEFHDWGGYPRLPKRLRPTQLFMYTTLESPMHSQLSDRSIITHFNVLQSYRLDSDVLSPYIPIGVENVPVITQPPLVKFANKFADAVAVVISNCGAPTSRMQFVEELSHVHEVHSYGACMHNRDLPPNRGEPLEIIYKYKFVVAMENSLCKDYVTEKLWRAFEWGVVPIVTSFHGHPNYTHFSPVPKAVINVADFKNVQKLAEYLKKVAHNEELYNEHIAHHIQGQEALMPLYRRWWDRYEDRNWWCRLSRQVLTPSEVSVLVNRRLKPDLSCAPAGFYH